MAAGSRPSTGPKPPEPGVIMSTTEPAGARKAPLLGRWRVAPSGVVSVTTAGAPALPDQARRLAAMLSGETSRDVRERVGFEALV